MTCRGLPALSPPLGEDAIVAVARGRGAGRGTIAAVEAHVEHCPACAARLSRERQVSEALRALAAATASAAPSEALEERLRAAFEAQHPAASPAWWKLAAVAAVLVAAGGWWWTSRDAGDARGPNPAIQATRTGAVAAPPSAAVAPTPEQAPREAANVTARRDETVRAARPRPAPADAEFVPLAAAAGLPPFESGVIVRMEMPLAALPAYGLEVIPGRRTPVEADLLIGQDGQARAIRLVRRSIARSGAEQ